MGFEEVADRNHTPVEVVVDHTLVGVAVVRTRSPVAVHNLVAVRTLEVVVRNLVEELDRNPEVEPARSLKLEGVRSLDTVEVVALGADLVAGRSLRSQALLLVIVVVEAAVVKPHLLASRSSATLFPSCSH